MTDLQLAVLLEYILSRLSDGDVLATTGEIEALVLDLRRQIASLRSEIIPF
jgi:hypothetical protein